MSLSPAALDGFGRIGLADAEPVALLDRRDSKYAFSLELLPAVLDDLRAAYRVLDPGHGPLVPYENRYFDTEGLELYRLHHNGRANRHKVRYRRYGDSALTHFEIKHKTARGRTRKTRVPAAAAPAPLPERIAEPAAIAALAGTPYAPEDLHPTLDVHFTRFTLIDAGFRDRCTVDTGLAFPPGPGVASGPGWPGLVIAEVKQDRFSRGCAFVGAMERHGIRPLRVSKYCLGVLQGVPGVKYNRFKETYRQLMRLTGRTGPLPFGPAAARRA